ncbi:class II fructose-bisphosphate aldolase [Blautia schinkii]|nr:class II fructose-bisphosphate aldolase [Blautia schinkii]
MLYTMKQLLEIANKENFAIPAPNIQNELTARAVIEAAEKMNSPLIIDIAFPIHPDIVFLGEMTRRLAEESPMPIAINLDHGGSRWADFDLCLKEVMPCIRAGFTSIMVDRSSLPYKENVSHVQMMTKIAHAMGISVEAELGHVGDGEKYDDKSDMVLTDPGEARSFIEETGVDCLAVSIGTAHGQYKGKPYLDFDRLEKIKTATDNFPLVLHGGSGTGEENLRKASRMGINKVNVGTDLFKASLNAVRTADLDGGKIYDIWQVINDSWRDELIRWIELLGCAGKAPEYLAADTVQKRRIHYMV